MKTKVILVFIFFLTNISSLLAHAVVTHSTLNVNSITPEQATQVKLMFNSRIELNLSQIFLVSKGDIKLLVKAHPGQKPGQVLLDLPPLTTGEYALQLKVFAADGHLSEDLIRFFVTK